VSDRKAESASAGAVVECHRLTKRFGAHTAVASIDLDVAAGELLALLGPSGCGKTTTLRLIAGFEDPDDGSILLTGRTVAGPGTSVPPERRRIGVVFQDYALFPHLSVAANVGFGLRDAGSRADRVAEMLDLVGLGPKADRRPHELSGGEQQRVAIARALAPDPAIVLLDEPFSNLDAALRARVRAEVQDILRAADATAIIVTHDQQEALGIADRIAVMNDGRILQIDTPTEVYRSPADRFVATFVGDAVLLPGWSDGTAAATPIGAVALVAGVPPGGVDVVLRPEHVRIRLDGSGEAIVSRITFLGHDQIVDATLPSGEIVRARLRPEARFAPGDRVTVNANAAAVAFPRARAASPPPTV
jgi:iron(III) transport system ATP-binding protein